MKSTISVLMFLALGTTHMSFVSDDKYAAVMEKNIQQVYTAQSIPEFQAAVNAFERIGAAEKTKWEPHYYASFGYIMMCAREQDSAKKDAYLDQALASVEKAKQLQKNESEIIALEGFIYMLRITVDPASRGQRYSARAYEAFNKAIALNKDNPRALSLLAQMQFGTAQFFNSPVTEACGTLAQSIEKFGTYKTSNPLAPQWGKAMAQGLQEKCK